MKEPKWILPSEKIHILRDIVKQDRKDLTDALDMLEECKGDVMDANGRKRERAIRIHAFLNKFKN